MAEPLEVESVVRGYHVYKDVWSAAVGTTVPCQVESFKPHDSYAVAMIKDDVVVGHVSKIRLNLAKQHHYYQDYYLLSRVCQL